MAPTVSPKVWTDAYLAAFARSAGIQLVTFDKGISPVRGPATGIAPKPDNSYMDLNLANKTAVITGASQGIGLAVAKTRWRARGVHVVLCARNGERAATMASAIAAEFGVQALAIAAADVTIAADVDRLVRQVEGALWRRRHPHRQCRRRRRRDDHGGLRRTLAALLGTTRHGGVAGAWRLVPNHAPAGWRRHPHNASICARQPLPTSPSTT